jgi:hypothetical protein
MTATVRTPSNDRAANKAYLKAKKEKAALELDWSRAMTRLRNDVTGQQPHLAAYVAALSNKADEQGVIISAAQHYAQLPKGAP